MAPAVAGNKKSVLLKKSCNLGKIYIIKPDALARYIKNSYKEKKNL
jgi:hypothetical protein